MASRSLGTLTIDLVTQTGGFKDGMTKAEKETKKRMDSIRRKVDDTAEFIGKALGGAAAAAAVGLVYLTQRTAEAVDAQADMAAQLDTTYNSLNVLGLAAQNAGVDMATVNGAVMKLNDAIGNLSKGTGGAGAKALQELGFSAQELATLPADEKIDAINKAIRDTVPAAEQASVAIDIFGKQAGTAILQLDPERLANAAEQARIFGLNLSEADASKIGQIGDTFDMFGQALKGIGTQLAKDVAPAVNGVGIAFLNAAKNSGGFAEIVGTSMNVVGGVVAALASSIDALLVRPLQLAGNVIYGFFQGIVVAITNVVAKAIELMDLIPGIDLTESAESVRRFSDQMEMMYASNEKRVREIFSEPLAGADFTDWIAKAKEASNKAAEDAAEAAVRNFTSPDSVDMSGASGAVSGMTIAGDATGASDAYLEQLRAMKAEEDAIAEQAYQQEKNRADREDALRKQKLEGTRAMLGNLSTLMNSHSKKAFEIGKVAAIAQAIIDTSAAAVRALKEGGPFLGPALAATMIASGLVQIQNIRRQQFNGGGNVSAGVSNTQAVNSASVPVQGPQAAADRVVYLRGVNPNDMFSGQQILDLVNDGILNGGTLRTA